MRFTKIFLPTAAALVLTAVLPAAAHAHYIWATIENGQARFALLENIAEAPSAPFQKYVDGLMPRSGDKTLTLGPPRSGARYAALSAGQNVVFAENIVGTRERDGDSYLLVYDAKGAASLAAAGTIVRSPAELLARREAQSLVVSLRLGGLPVRSSEVSVQWPGSPDPVSVKTDNSGEARTPWPTAPVPAGFVGIRAMTTEAIPGTVMGKKYATVHRWATLTFPVPAREETEKPFTQTLRASYSGQHEVVSNSAFNKTLFAGALTREQLIIHLQQRALVHAETDRILKAAPAARNVPYGDAQKTVLKLLASDLTGLGVGWPKPSDARPLTKRLLERIRASEKTGPFFALGVQHVYYGGITNGGRSIGEMIAEQIKFSPTYYSQSDGYTEYLPLVNRITDPDARKEMIRGGQAAYRYIIDSSNEPIFQAKKP